MVQNMNDLWQQLPAGVDPAPLQSLASDTSLSILHALLTEFRSELTTQRQTIAKAAQNQDKATLGNSFHTTKGLAATFGLKDLKSASAAMEQKLTTQAGQDLADIKRSFENHITTADGLVTDLLTRIEKYL